MRTENALIGAAIFFVIVAIVGFFVYDRCTGTTVQLSGTVSRVWEVHEVHYDKNGTSHYDAYMIGVNMKNRYIETDVGKNRFESFNKGTPVVCRFTVGGKTGCYYLTDVLIDCRAERN